MLISHKKEFIFVHIYKTAGTSVSNAFLPHSRLIDRLVFEFWFSRKLISQFIKLMGWQHHGQREFCGVEKHATAHEIREFIGPKKYRTYFSFVFVRNPFDLEVSLYHYIRQAKIHKDHKIVSNMSFEEFVSWHLDQTPPTLLEFISDPVSKEIIVDYVGYFENLNEDVGRIQEHLKIAKPHSVTHRNVSFKRKKKNYREYYTDESQKRVEEYYKRDLEVLGYDFTGLQRPLINQIGA